jgi:hypothetical protein
VNGAEKERRSTFGRAKTNKSWGKKKEDEDGFEKVGYTRRDLLHNVGGKRLG